MWTGTNRADEMLLERDTTIMLQRGRHMQPGLPYWNKTTKPQSEYAIERLTYV